MHLRSIAFMVTSVVGSAAFAACEEPESSGGIANAGGATTGGSSGKGGAAGMTGGSSGKGGSAGTTGGSSGKGGTTGGSAGAAGDGGFGGDPGDGEGGSPGGEGGGAGAPDATLPFSVRFAAKVGTEAFSCASTYTNVGADASTLHPVDFKFYVHDLRLIDAAGMEVPVTLTQDGVWQHQGVALLDFEDDTGSCSNGTAAMNDAIVGTVPFGVYQGIVFKLGVPFALNHTDLATAPAPLNLSSMFWSWNSGHLFLSLMTSAETGATTRFENVLHVGSTGCVGDAQAGGVSSCAKPNRPEYRFPDFRLGHSVAVADVKEILQKSNLKTDLCHSFTADTCTWPFEYLGINWFTGSLTPTTQRFFRME